MMMRSSLLLVCGGLWLATNVLAAERRPGEVLTLNRRIDPTTATMAPLASIAPTAVVVDGDSYLAMGSSSGGAGLVRKVWRHEPATGRQTLLAVTSIPGNFIHGLNVLAKGAGDRVYLLSGTSVTSAEGLLEIRLDTGEQRLISETVRSLRDLVVAGNGNLVAITSPGTVVILDSEGEILATENVGSGLQALTLLSDGRVVGIAGNGLVAPNHEAQLYQVDPSSGELTSLATIPGIGIRNSTLRLSAAADGGYFVSSRVSNSNFQLFRLFPGTLDLMEIPLPEGVRIPAVSDLDVDASGDLLLTAHDTRLNAAGLFVTFRFHSETGDVSLALGNRLSPTTAGHMALGSDWALYFTSGSGSDRDRVYRQDLTTGGVTMVTSKAVEGAVLTSAAQVAVWGNDLFVINQTDNNQNSHLVRVDARSGSQTNLTMVGNRLFLRHMVYDEASGDLFLSAWGGHTEGCCGSIIRLRPEPGAVPEFVTTTGYLGNPEGLRMAPDGSLWVTGRTEDSRGVYRVDPETGEQSVITEDPRLVHPHYLALLDNGDLLIGDFGHVTDPGGRIYRRHAGTGEVTLFLDGLAGDPDWETQLSGMVDLLLVPGEEVGPVPALSMGLLADDRLRLTWTEESGPWQLDVTTDLGLEGWTEAEAEPEDRGGGVWGVDIPMSDDQQFFRLRQP
jgi:hypothetical protein